MTLERIETPDQKLSRKIQADFAAQHRENVRLNIERRIEVAKVQGNDILLSHLLNELQQL